MIIEKRHDHLIALSSIYFDEKVSFCGRPYIYLAAHKKDSSGWDENTIGIAIRDNDDFDKGLQYETDFENFENVLHELINWMKDHEQGVSNFEDVLELFEFFPDCGCDRKTW